MPRHAPAERSRSADRAGRNAMRPASQASLPRDCEYRCTLGMRPPDISSASQAIVRRSAIVASAIVPSVTLRMPSRPDVPRTVARSTTSRPAARAAAGPAPFAASRTSAIERNRRARRMQVERGRVGRIATGHDDDARADADAVAMQVRRCRRREHDAGPVVAREDERLLDRSGREHDLASANLPEPLARRYRPQAQADDP